MINKYLINGHIHETNAFFPLLKYCLIPVIAWNTVPYPPTHEAAKCYFEPFLQMHPWLEKNNNNRNKNNRNNKIKALKTNVS